MFIKHCLGSGPGGLKTKRKRRRWSGRNWLKNDQKVILLEKPKLARKLVCEEGSLILVQYHHCSRTDTFLAHSWSRRGLTEHCLLDRMKEKEKKRRLVGKTFCASIQGGGAGGRQGHQNSMW